MEPVDLGPMPTTELPPDFEIIDHTADWALRVFGVDLTQLLLNAATGMTSLLVEDVGTIAENIEHHVIIDSLDPESLLVDWLTELAYWAESELLVFSRILLKDVSETHLKAILVGDHVPTLAKHIKAVTYHELEIKKTDVGLVTTVVFDV